MCRDEPEVEETIQVEDVQPVIKTEAKAEVVVEESKEVVEESEDVIPTSEDVKVEEPIVEDLFKVEEYAHDSNEIQKVLDDAIEGGAYEIVKIETGAENMGDLVRVRGFLLFGGVWWFFRNFSFRS